MAPVGKVPRVLWALGAQCSPTRTWMPNSRPRASATKAGSVFSGTTGTTAARFSAPAVRRLKKGDTLIVCGDFGFLWKGGKKEEALLKKIELRKPSKPLYQTN